MVQMGPIKAQELQRQLGRLPAGTRLHLVVDAGATSFPLGLPHHASITRDGWLHWEAILLSSLRRPWLDAAVGLG